MRSLAQSLCSLRGFVWKGIKNKRSANTFGMFCTVWGTLGLERSRSRKGSQRTAEMIKWVQTNGSIRKGCGQQVMQIGKIVFSLLTFHFLEILNAG